MARKRLIAVVTGSRGEYGILRPVMQAIRAQRKLRLQLIVAGMHLQKEFGRTADEIRADGFRIDSRVAMQSGRDELLAPARAIGKGVSGIALSLEKLCSDLVVVLGDRVEAMAGALAASASSRILAHIHGGDVAPGHLDDAFRHAITKLAHIHFTASQDAARRVIKLGEQPANVHVVGAPGLDELRTIQKPPPGWLAGRFGFPRGRDVALILHHPIGRPARAERAVMANILDAVATLDCCGLIIYPNSDPGHSGIIKAIEQRVNKDKNNQWVSRKSLPREEFIQCLKAACVLVGNSSAGIIEARSACTPAVNIGPRQNGRLKAGPSVLDCLEHTTAIRAALGRAMRKKMRSDSRNVYGFGGAGLKIASILAGPSVSDNLIPKRINY